MNIYFYSVIQERGFLPDEGEFQTYGIRILERSAKDGEWTAEFHDVSPDYNFVISLAQLCNTYQVYPEHFRDVWDDALAVG